MRVSRLAVVLALAALPAASGCGSKGASAAIGRSLEVMVVDAETGEPVEGVHLSLLRSRGRAGKELPPLTTDYEGIALWTSSSAFWDRDRGAGLRVEDPLGRYLGREVDIRRTRERRRPGSIDALTVPLERGVAVRLDVRGEDGTPVPSRLVVWARGLPGGRVFESPGAGAAELGPLPAGPAKIFVTADGYVTRALDVRIPRRRSDTGPGDLGAVELARGGATLAGRVSPDLPIRPTDAYLRFAGAGLSAPVDASGRFRFEGLPRTEGTLVLRRDGRELFSKAVAVHGPHLDLGVVSP